MKIFRIAVKPSLLDTLTQKQKEEIVQKFLNGVTKQEIFAEYHLSDISLKELLIKSVGEDKYKEILMENHRARSMERKVSLKPEQILQLFMEGQSVYSISKTLNVSPPVVSRIIKETIGEEKYQQQQLLRQRQHKGDSAELQSEIVKMFYNGKSITSIGLKVGLFNSQVTEILKQHIPIEKFNEIKNRYIEKAKISRWNFLELNNPQQDARKIAYDYGKLQNSLYEEVKNAYLKERMSLEDIAIKFNVDIIALYKFIENQKNSPFFKIK